VDEDRLVRRAAGAAVDPLELAMALDPCVKAVLCPLGNAVLGALNGIITAQVAFLETELATITATLLTLQIQLIPIQAARALANTAVAAVRSAGNLVPVSVMAGCFDAGDLMLKLNASLDSSVAIANHVLDEANRSLSYQAELQQLQTDINATIDKFNQIKLAISECQ
jgi:hypothetical protein